MEVPELSCQKILEIVHPYIDRELDEVQAAEVERHLEQCDDCDLTYRGQVALRSALQHGSFYYRAPADLKKRITSYFKKGSGKPTAHSASSTAATPS